MEENFNEREAQSKEPRYLSIFLGRLCSGNHERYVQNVQEHHPIGTQMCPECHHFETLDSGIADVIRH